MSEDNATHPSFSESHFGDTSESLRDATESTHHVRQSPSLNASLKSHLSYEDVRLPSVSSQMSGCGSDTYHTSMEFEIPNSDDYLPSPSDVYSFRYASTFCFCIVNTLVS